MVAKTKSAVLTLLRPGERLGRSCRGACTRRLSRTGAELGTLLHRPGRGRHLPFYWIAIPHDWSRVLVMHAHGGPETGPPLSERSRKDLERWTVSVKAGYAWAGST